MSAIVNYDSPVKMRPSPILRPGLETVTGQKSKMPASRRNLGKHQEQSFKIRCTPQPEEPVSPEERNETPEGLSPKKFSLRSGFPKLPFMKKKQEGLKERTNSEQSLSPMTVATEANSSRGSLNDASFGSLQSSFASMSGSRSNLTFDTPRNIRPPSSGNLQKGRIKSRRSLASDPSFKSVQKTESCPVSHEEIAGSPRNLSRSNSCGRTKSRRSLTSPVSSKSTTKGRTKSRRSLVLD